MKIIVFVSLFLLLVSFSGNAQTVDLDRYEVGIDLLWIIQRNSVPMSLFAKKIESRPKKKGFGYVRKGYRLRVGGYYSRPNEETYANGFFSLRTTNYSFLLRPGYEWHKKIKWLDVFYGADLNFAFDGRKTQNLHVSLNYEEGGYYNTLYNQKWNSMNIGVAPVAGISIKIINGLNLTLESTANLSYIENTNVYTNSIDGFEDIQIKGKGFDFHLFPLYTMNASFTF